MMVDYLRPNTLDDALAAVAAGGRVAAGCTDIYPFTTAPALEIGADRPIVDITEISALRGVRHDENGTRIGATTTWTEIAEAQDLPPCFDALRQAAREVGGVQIQNAGTLGGNLCTASPAADGVPPLLALEAEVELRSSAGRRTLPLGAFLTGPRKTALRADEIVTAVIVPDAAQRGASRFLKLGARRYLVISIAMVAARLIVSEGRIAEAAIAVGSCGPTASRLFDVEAALRDAPAGPEALARIKAQAVSAALRPISDIRADAAYRLEAATELTRRAVAELLAGDVPSMRDAA